MLPITALDAAAFTVPTDRPEEDGTLAWASTTLVVVHAAGGGRTGLGYTYAERAVAGLIGDLLAPLVVGRDAMAIPQLRHDLLARVRNLGATGLLAMAISAVDAALWDLKARVLGVSLVTLLGDARERVPVYGSGGFTSYDAATLRAQLEGWVAEGIAQVKIKVGRGHGLARVREARGAIGDATDLMVDANGAYGRKQAQEMAERYAAAGVVWFEEPVPHWDRAGLAAVRRAAPASIEVSAGEYGWTPVELQQLLDARAVDVLQADATRCTGLSGFLQVGAQCAGQGVPLSSHCAPALHLHAACALPALRHVEWFHDHVRIERLLFDGAPRVERGCIVPDRGAPGMGLTLKLADAERYRV